MIDIVGLGPGDLSRTAPSALDLLLDEAVTVIVRTREHPAAEQLAERRPVIFCDDLYESEESFDRTYKRIVERVTAAAEEGPVVYAVPGSPKVGEFAVGMLTDRPDVRLHPAESFLDLIFSTVGIDPLDRGFQLLNGHDLPVVLNFSVPTVIGHIDSPVVLADVAARIDRTAPDDLEIRVLAGLGAADERMWAGPPAAAPSEMAGVRTSMFVPAHENGLVGAVDVMRRLRDECPWDQKQTHASLIRYLVEETYELVEALGFLGESAEDDAAAYAEVEDELGDVLLQVLFHAVIAEDAGAFSIDDVAHTLRTKMVRRHPHVFADVEAADAEAVKRNWDQIKQDERGAPSESLFDGVPAMPGLSRAAELGRRAARVGFDWADVASVRAAISEELVELDEAQTPAEQQSELGDVLLSVVNLARHLGIEPEAAIQAASARFERRFRALERMADLTVTSVEEMNRLWAEVKRAE